MLGSGVRSARNPGAGGAVRAILAVYNPAFLFQKLVCAVRAILDAYNLAFFLFQELV
jgi:hypothetical protein